MGLRGVERTVRKRLAWLAPRALCATTALFMASGCEFPGSAAPITIVSKNSQQPQLSNPTIGAPITNPPGGPPPVVTTTTARPPAVTTTTARPPSVTTTTTVGPVGDSVSASVERWASGSGTTLVSSGFPLPPGRLTASQLANVQVFVAGVEQAVAVRDFGARHRDGSLRSVGLQFRVNADSGSPLAAEVRFGQTRGVADITYTAPNWDEAEGAILPTNLDYIASTDIVFRPVQKRSLSPTGPQFDFWEQAFVDWSWYHWNGWGQYTAGGAVTGSDCARVSVPNDVGCSGNPGSNYYDRALNHVMQWARGVNANSRASNSYGGHVNAQHQGNPARAQPSSVYYRRGIRIALEHAKAIISVGAMQPNNLQPDGLAIAYILTGDTRHIDALRSQNLRGCYFNIRDAVDRGQYGEGRIQVRCMLNALFLGILGVTEQDPNGRTPYQAADNFVAQWLNIQKPDGHFEYRLETENNASPQGQSNFMEALRGSGMILWSRYRAGVGSNPTQTQIDTSIRAQVDFLWNTQWLGAGGQSPVGQERSNTFRYHYRNPSSPTYSGGATTLYFNNAGINADFAEIFAYVGHRYGEAVYRDRADTILRAYAADMDNAFYSGAKQFNEQFLALPYLWYRAN